jgi:hypothetical protein
MKLLPDMARQFAGLVQGLLLQAIHWTAGTIEATVCSESTSPLVGRLQPSAVLVFACGCRTFEQTHLRECLDGFVRALPSREEVAPLGVDYGADGPTPDTVTHIHIHVDIHIHSTHTQHTAHST